MVQPLADSLRLATLALDPTGQAAVSDAIVQQHLENGPAPIVVRADADAGRRAVERAAADLGIILPEANAPASDDLGAKIKGQLVKLAKKPLFAERNLQVLDLVGEQAGVAVKITGKLVAADDPLVKDDPNRSAYSQRMADNGAPVAWTQLGGGIFPRAGMSTSIPIGGVGFVTAGFSANASLGYSMLAPYPLELASTGQALKDATIDLPFSSRKAKALAEGSELLLRGTGQIAGHAGIGVGQQFGNDFAVLGVSAHGGVGYSQSGEVALRVKRLDRGKVYVSVSMVEANSKSANLGLQAGVDVKIKENLPDLGGGIYKKGAELASDQVEKQLERWLKVDFSAVHARSHTERAVANYVFDLYDPDAAKAYERLMLLDATKADELVEASRQAAARGEAAIPSVRSAKLEEQIRAQATNLDAHVGPKSVLSYVASASDTHGLLRTNEGDIRYARADLTRAYSGLFSQIVIGELRVDRQLIATKWPSKDVEYHYHLRGTVLNDGITSKNDVRQFLELAKSLHAFGDGHEALLADSGYLGSFDKTDRIVDVFVTQAGLKAFVDVATRDPDRLLRAHAEAYERIDAPSTARGAWKIPPWLYTEHPKYAEAMSLLERGPEYQGAGHARSRNDLYRSLTGRSLPDDSTAHNEVKALIQLAKEVGAIEDPGAQISVFAERQNERRFSFSRSLATISAVAGPEAMVVNELTIRDQKKPEHTLVFKTEGALVDPSGEIADRLANPR